MTYVPPKEIRLIFPLLLRKDGKPRKRQKSVLLSMNGDILCIKRGVVVEGPLWIKEVCDALCEMCRNEDYEYFVSNRKPKQ